MVLKRKHRIHDRHLFKHIILAFSNEHFMCPVEGYFEVYLPWCFKTRQVKTYYQPRELNNCSSLQSIHYSLYSPWWRHQIETFPALLAICAGISPVTGEFPSQRSVTRSFDVFFDLHPNKRLRKQSWDWWFEMPSSLLWHHCNETHRNLYALNIFPVVSPYLSSYRCINYETVYLQTWHFLMH